ncbi:MAG: methyl-accepting chemotaxis protein [Magnetococcus sp. DMHC-6]
MLKLRLSTKLIGLFLIFGIVPFMTIGIYSYQISSAALEQKALDQLVQVREGKTIEIQRYFQTIVKQLQTYSENQTVISATEEFKQAFDKVESEAGLAYDKDLKQAEERLRAVYMVQKSKTVGASENAQALWWPREKRARILQHTYIANNPYPLDEKNKLLDPQDGTTYSSVHAKYHSYFNKRVQTFGFYDIFLVDAVTGTIFYTVNKEVDFATNLIDGPYRESNLAKAFLGARNLTDESRGVFFADFEPYAPSNNSSQAFFSTPIFKDSKKIGILIFQMPIEQINEIMTFQGRWEKVGLGKTGEAFLVGPDYLLRSNSRFMIENPTSFLEDLKAVGVAEPVLDRMKAFGTAIGILPYKNSDVKDSLAGETSDQLGGAKSYRGKEVLVAHGPIDLPGGVRWALMVTLQTHEAFDSLESMRGAMWIMGSICLIAVVLVGWFFARSISRPLMEIIGVVSTSSAQIAATINEQERVSSQQAAAVNQTNTTMEELGTSSRQSAEQAESAASGSKKALELVEHGMGRVEEMLSGMEITKTKVGAIAREILKLSEQTSQIREITATVSEFANETKMLAMNAAVEAVRAGEHGKGFSVLAVETRKLADESKRSAGRINGLVGEIQKATNTTVMVTDEGAKTVESSALIARQTAETFRDVADAVNLSSDSAQQISMNVRQQSVAIKQVVEAIKAINAGARETSTGMAQLKEGGRTLNEAAQMLKRLV